MDIQKSGHEGPLGSNFKLRHFKKEMRAWWGVVHKGGESMMQDLQESGYEGVWIRGPGLIILFIIIFFFSMLDFTNLFPLPDIYQIQLKQGPEYIYLFYFS